MSEKVNSNSDSSEEVPSESAVEGANWSRRKAVLALAGSFGAMLAFVSGCRSEGDSTPVSENEEDNCKYWGPNLDNCTLADLERHTEGYFRQARKYIEKEHLYDGRRAKLMIGEYEGAFTIAGRVDNEILKSTFLDLINEELRSAGGELFNRGYFEDARDIWDLLPDGVDKDRLLLGVRGALKEVDAEAEQRRVDGLDKRCSVDKDGEDFPGAYKKEVSGEDRFEIPAPRAGLLKVRASVGDDGIAVLKIKKDKNSARVIIVHGYEPFNVAKDRKWWGPRCGSDRRLGRMYWTPIDVGEYPENYEVRLRVDGLKPGEEVVFFLGSVSTLQ